MQASIPNIGEVSIGASNRFKIPERHTTVDLGAMQLNNSFAEKQSMASSRYSKNTFTSSEGGSIAEISIVLRSLSSEMKENWIVSQFFKD